MSRAGAARCHLRGLARGLLFAAWAAAAGTSFAASPLEADEASVKAAFALNFAKFTEWPQARMAANAGQFTLCQFGGSDSLAGALQTLEGRTVQGLHIRFRRIDSSLEASDCLLLFASGSSAPPPLPRGSAVLTVGDEPGFANQGGMIGFVRSGARLRFEVNLGALQRAGLALSSQVLELASNVIDLPHGPAH